MHQFLDKNSNFALFPSDEQNKKAKKASVKGGVKRYAFI